MNTSKRALATLALAATAVLSACGAGPIDDSAAGATLDNGRVKQVLGHLFDGVGTVHVHYASADPKDKATGEADVVLGPPVQANIALNSGSIPAETGSIIIKDGKAYLNQPSFKGKWFIMSSAADGVSGEPAFGQTLFERQFLGPNTTATYKGTATVGGISTRQYVLTATLPASASASASATTSPSAVPTPSGPITVATVWIDTTGRLIQYTYSPANDGQWTTATYSKWGESVTVETPQDTVVVDGALDGSF